MYKHYVKQQSKTVIGHALHNWNELKTQVIVGEVEGVTVRMTGRVKGPMAKRITTTKGHIGSKTLSRPIREYNHQVRTQVGIIGVKITTG